jgi:hypothetical protein
MASTSIRSPRLPAAKSGESHRETGQHVTSTLTTLAEHWRLRGTPYVIAVLPSAVGFLLADGFILVTGRGFLPGIPFFTAGYLVSEGVYRYVSRHRAPPSAQSARQGPVARGTGS